MPQTVVQMFNGSDYLREILIPSVSISIHFHTQDPFCYKCSFSGYKDSNQKEETTVRPSFLYGRNLIL